MNILKKINSIIKKTYQNSIWSKNSMERVFRPYIDDSVKKILSDWIEKNTGTRISEEELEDLTSLKFRMHEPYEFPEEFNKLTKITELYIDGTVFPKGIENFPYLNYLNIGCSMHMIDTIPKGIGQLHNLSKLFIRGGWHPDLDSEVVKLKKLRHLKVYDTFRLEALPEAITEITSLTDLTTLNMPLLELPRDIGKLNNLTKLHLIGIKVATLPKEIGQLNKLESFKMLSVELSHLPKAIGNLKALRSLHIVGDRLANIPKEIGELDNLAYLFIAAPFAQEIPKEIAKLTNLRTLYIVADCKNGIPDEIKKMNAQIIIDTPNEKFKKEEEYEPQ